MQQHALLCESVKAVRTIMEQIVKAPASSCSYVCQQSCAGFAQPRRLAAYVDDALAAAQRDVELSGEGDARYARRRSYFRRPACT